MAGNIRNDWEPVVLNSRGRKKKAHPGAANTVTQKKYGAGSNRQKGGSDARKFESSATIDEEGESLALNIVSHAQAQAIQAGRAEKGWKQVDLARAINVNVSVIRDYENGKAVPNQQLLGKMERQLGVRLRGKRVGEKFGKKK
eukprot:TRINITY_DN615_c0_g3_i2.p1 TRINITY_DN615_c0_g3~~TRINITY_DN615_c0_g3_i2.p1  ORF type:complete len:143 (+),score=31.75 TRINITY_DN615_c0_g3_i2:87-515(+)